MIDSFKYLKINLPNPKQKVKSKFKLSIKQRHYNKK